MQENPYRYAVEKLTTALECLTTHPGDARERLNSTFSTILPLREDDFPPEFRAEWNWVMKSLTRFGPLLNYKGKVWRGSVENTLKRIRKKTASNIIEVICELYWAVSRNKRYL